VPLSSRVLAIFLDNSDLRTSDYLFPDGKAGKPRSNMAMTEVLRRMGRGDITVHGFRSTFRDWVAERTKFTREVIEMTLAHPVVEAAYRRGDLFDKRTPLNGAWAAFCNAPAASGRDKVIPMRRSR
jgi:integrase